MLALLVAGIYCFWYFTNDRRIRSQAEDYLQAATGCRVKISKASFSLFRGVELRNVRVVRPPVASRPKAPPVFQAQRVLLKYDPWSLLLGQFRPSHVTCDRPIVTVEYDSSSKSSDGSVPLGLFGQDYQSAFGHLERLRPLPAIEVRHGLLRMIAVSDGVRDEPIETPLNLSMQPAGPGQSVYHVLFEKLRDNQEPSITGMLDYDLTSGLTSNISGSIPGIDDIPNSLPAVYRQWLRQYDIRGARAHFRQVGAAQQGSLGTYEVDLVDLSLRLPEEQGGLLLKHVSGRIILDDNEVKIENVTAQVAQAGNATFHISGRYLGYAANSPFEVGLAGGDFDMPERDAFTGKLGGIVKMLDTCYRPRGRIGELKLSISRDAGGRVSLQGVALASGMSGMAHQFKYPMTDIYGTIRFTEKRVDFERLACRHDGAAAEVSGFADIDGHNFEIRASGQNVAFDEQFASALRGPLPRSFMEAWDNLKPVGSASGSTVISRQAGQDRHHIQVTMKLDGQAGATWQGYQLSSLIGQLKVNDGDIAFESITGKAGDMNCTISGTIRRADSDQNDMDLSISAKRLPIDQTLMQLLSSDNKSLLSALHATGGIGRLSANLKRNSGGQTQYTIEAWPSDVSYQLDAFPYAVTNAGGKVVLQPGVIAFENFDGRHGASNISVNGKVYLNQGRQGPGGRGLDLQIQAKDVPCDEDFLNALQAVPAANRAWKRLAPEGKADFNLIYRQNLSSRGQGRPAAPVPSEDVDYELTVEPKGMSICYAGLPYPFCSVTGKAIVTPRQVRLENMRAAEGEFTAAINGTISLGQRQDLADLAVKALHVPLTADLLRAISNSAGPIAACISPQGQCDMDFSKLRFSVDGNAADGPASAGAATSSAGPANWHIEGQLTLRDAVIDVGFGPKKLDGALQGIATMDAGALSVKADADFASMELGGQTLKDVHAELSKLAASNSILIKEIAAAVLGGRLAGAAEVRLGRNVECGLQLEVHDLQLAEVFKKNAQQPNAIKAEGDLSGSIRLRAILGDPSSRQAEGDLWISNAKITQMPVMLGMQRALFVPLPGESAFSEGVMRYEVKGNTLAFSEIYFAGTASIVGSGSVNLANDSLRLTFLARPGKLPRIDSLSELLDNLARELNEVRVSGTLAKPAFRNVPLGSIEDTIRRLTNPPKD